MVHPIKLRHWKALFAMIPCMSASIHDLQRLKLMSWMDWMRGMILIRVVREDTSFFSYVWMARVWSLLNITPEDRNSLIRLTLSSM